MSERRVAALNPGVELDLGTVVLDVDPPCSRRDRWHSGIYRRVVCLSRPHRQPEPAPLAGQIVVGCLEADIVQGRPGPVVAGMKPAAVLTGRRPDSKGKMR